MKLTDKLHHGNFILAQGIYNVIWFSWIQIPPYLWDELNPKGSLLTTALLKAKLFLTWGKTWLVWIKNDHLLARRVGKSIIKKIISSWEKQVFSLCSPIIISNPSFIIPIQEELSPLSNDTKQGDNLFWKYFKIYTFQFSKSF